MKKENEELLTSELFLEISMSRKEKIAKLKEQRDKLIEEIKENSTKLAGFKKEMETALEKIKDINKKLFSSKKEKFKIKREMNKEIRLERKLNKLMTREESYIKVSNFTTEDVKTR